VTIKTQIKSVLYVMVALVFIGPLAYAAAPVSPPASTTSTVSAAPAASASPSVPVEPVVSSAPPAPNPENNPMLSAFMKSGAKIYYLGANSGLYGWFITRDNQVQFAYTMPGSQSILIGVLYDGAGDEVSSQQIKKLYETNRDVNSFFSNMNSMQSPIQTMQTPSLQMESPSGSPISSASSFQPPASPPGVILLEALQSASGVDVGATSAPKLYMIFDPNCPHCHDTWQKLRTMIFGGKLQVRLVPIGAFGPDSERAAAQFLRVANPLDAWDKYVAGDKDQLAGAPDAIALDAVHNNHVLVDAWKIRTTPYIVYRAKDGQVKIVQGEPENPDSLVNDVGP
jgi:thiol:disulfide interchange protein DsbG